MRRVEQSSYHNSGLYSRKENTNFRNKKLKIANIETICKFNQYGFCKFLSQCRKQHINDICSNNQYNSNTCLLRNPRVCKYFSNFQRCKFAEQCAYLHHSITIAERCSFLHCSLLERDHTSSAEVQALTQEVSELRVEIDRLGKGTDARLRVHTLTRSISLG